MSSTPSASKEESFDEFYSEVCWSSNHNHSISLLSGTPGRFLRTNLIRCSNSINIIFQVKEIEKRDSVLTPKQQIERLLRPGSTYFNLNPYEVLQVEPDATLDEIKKKYRRLSILVHPDKNIVSIYQCWVFYECVWVWIYLVVCFTVQLQCKFK